MKLFKHIFFSLKTLFVILIGFAGFSTCVAQSIVGKWHRAGTSVFKIDKATGKQTPLHTAEQQKQFDEAAAANEYNEVLEFKSNNTYVMRATAKDADPVENTRAYTLSGKNLEMNIPLVRNEKSTYSIKSLDATTLVLDMVFMNNLNRLIYKRM